MQLKLERDTTIHVELNQIEIYANVNGERLSVLRNKDTIQELIERGLLNEDKLRESEMPDEVFNYYNHYHGGGRAVQNECLYIKLKHPMF